MVRFGSVIKVVSVTSSSKQVGDTPLLAEHVAAAGDEARLLELPQRQVDGDAAGLRHRLLPFAVVGADAIHHPLADVQDQTGFLGQRDELRR